MKQGKPARLFDEEGDDIVELPREQAINLSGANRLTLFQADLKQQLEARRPGRVARMAFQHFDDHRKKYQAAYWIFLAGIVPVSFLLMIIGIAKNERGARLDDSAMQKSGDDLFYLGAVLISIEVAILFSLMMLLALIEKKFSSPYLSVINQHFESIEAEVDAITEEAYVSPQCNHGFYEDYIKGEFSKAQTNQFFAKAKAVRASAAPGEDDCSPRTSRPAGQ